jgi:hypothetical protein
VYGAGMPQSDALESHARRFVTLALSLARIDPKEIDAYYGPPELDTRKRGPAPSPDALHASLVRLASDLDGDAPSARRDRLRERVSHLIALTEIIKTPRSLRFDDEARRVYGVGSVAVDENRLRRARASLEYLLPGRGSLAVRLAAYRDRFVIPEERRKTVFLQALAECRTRTLSHWPLPYSENLHVDWTSEVDAAWHHYQGQYRSLLQINPIAVAYLGSALDVACHEAYPGHHAQFVTMSADAGPSGLPVEETVVILRSPDQVLREGAANYGVDLAFPPSDRLAFTRNVLFPLAGFDPREAARYVQVHRLAGDLALSVMPILRDYRDGKLASGDAVAALVNDAAVSSPQDLLRFTNKLGAYTTGYTIAKGLVRDCVTARARGGDRWPVLRKIVATMDLTVLDPKTCLPAQF